MSDFGNYKCGIKVLEVWKIRREFCIFVETFVADAAF